MSEASLQIAEKRREVKGKGEKERYAHLNAEFQRTARRDKQAYLSDQCKEIEENNSMGKTRDLFKKLEIPREHFMQRGLIPLSPPSELQEIPVATREQSGVLCFHSR